jgi:beta-galactosidase/beta-glucuronidase
VTKQIGFRTVELITKPYDDKQIGNSFYFEINAVPIFLKGLFTLFIPSFNIRVELYSC